MKLTSLALLLVLSTAIVACNRIASIQDRLIIPAATPTLAPPPQMPSNPSTPEPPAASDALPATPKPADTPEPASTPFVVLTPLAVLPSYTPEPTATRTPRPTAAPLDSESRQAKREEYIERCKHWALREMTPIVFNKFEELNPHNMTDLQRTLWGSVIVSADGYEDRITTIDKYTSDNDYLQWCQDYYSEPLSEKNVNKRNSEVYRLLCIRELIEQAMTFEDYAEDAYKHHSESQKDRPMSLVLVNQAIRILNWMDISGDTLLALEEKPHELINRLREDSYQGRYIEANISFTWNGIKWPIKDLKSEDLEWWNIEDVWDTEHCGNYYPQLFLGRWVPLDDFELEKESLEDARERLEEIQKKHNWPNSADGEERNIILRLDE